MLCFAYQRTNFIEDMFPVPLKLIRFQKEDLEILYGFGYIDGRSKEVLKTLYDIETTGYDMPTNSKSDLFLRMTTSNIIINMTESRNILNLLCKRIRKSISFFAMVSTLFISFSSFCKFRSRSLANINE